MASDSGRRSACKVIRDLSWQYDIIWLQEVHSVEADIKAQFGKWLPGWQFCISAFRDALGFPVSSTGGVVMAFRPGLASGPIAHKILINGRCQVASIPIQGTFTFHIGNLHNFDLHRSQVVACSRHLAYLAELERKHLKFTQFFCAGISILMAMEADIFELVALFPMLW